MHVPRWQAKQDPEGIMVELDEGESETSSWAFSNPTPRMGTPLDAQNYGI